MPRTARLRSALSMPWLIFQAIPLPAGCFMYFRYLSVLLLFALPAVCASSRILRVCADPNNLPFSNEGRAGFENRLAELVANDLKMQVRYTWWAERRSFLKNSLNAGLCDVVLGV